MARLDFEVERVARNLELKAACDEDSLEHVHARAMSLGAGTFTDVIQTDTYFLVSSGRLKLREIVPAEGGASAELIAYRRADEPGSRWSDYHLTSLSAESAVAVKQALSITCGVSILVKKRRSIGVWRNTRIHLDVVEGIGSFVELETVVQPGDGDEDVHGEHQHAILMLELTGMPVVSGSYSDLAGAGARSAPSINHEKGFPE